MGQDYRPTNQHSTMQATRRAGTRTLPGCAPPCASSNPARRGACASCSRCRLSCRTWLGEAKRGRGGPAAGVHVRRLALSPGTLPPGSRWRGAWATLQASARRTAQRHTRIFVNIAPRGGSVVCAKGAREACACVRAAMYEAWRPQPRVSFKICVADRGRGGKFILSEIKRPKRSEVKLPPGARGPTAPAGAAGAQEKRELL